MDTDIVRRLRAGTAGGGAYSKLRIEAAAEIEALRDEVNSRYTKQEVGDLQASEAELVSRPLRAQIERLERELAHERNRADDAEDREKAYIDRLVQDEERARRGW